MDKEIFVVDADKYKKINSSKLIDYCSRPNNVSTQFMFID